MRISAHMKPHGLVLASLLTLAAAPTAQAALITWIMPEPFFSGVAPGTPGTFVYDTELNEVVAFEFATPDGSGVDVAENPITFDGLVYDSRAAGFTLKGGPLLFFFAGTEDAITHFLGLIFTEGDVRNVLDGSLGSAITTFFVLGEATGTGGLDDVFITANRFEVAPVFGTLAMHVPEPATLALLGLGLMGIGLSRRRRSAAAMDLPK